MINLIFLFFQSEDHVDDLDTRSEVSSSPGNSSHAHPLPSETSSQSGKINSIKVHGFEFLCKYNYFNRERRRWRRRIARAQEKAQKIKES